MQLHDLTLTELSAGLAAKKFSSRDIVDALLGRIAKANGKLHAFIEVYAKEAKAIADGADKARAGGFRSGHCMACPSPTRICATSPAASAPAAPRCSRSASPPRPPTPSSG